MQIVLQDDKKNVIKNSLEISWRLTDYTTYKYMAVKKSEACN